MLGRRQDVRLRRVHDHHAAARRLRDVDVVEPDAGPPDHHEVVGRGEHLGRHLGRAADHERGDTGERREQLLGREADLHLDVEPRGAHRVEAAFGERFGDEDALVP